MIERRRPQREKAEDDYVVGYRKPPLHTRFKPGQSGNPKGRSKGTSNFRTDVKSTLKAPVKVTRDGKPRKVSTQEAALLRLREKALGGDARALDQLINLARIYNDDELTTAAVMSTDDAGLLEIYNKRVLSGAAGLADLASDRSATQKPLSNPTGAGNARADRKPGIKRVRLKEYAQSDDGQPE
jgi:hypothetical protein